MIQKLVTFARGLPWWAWVLVGLAILYLFNMASGSIYSRKLWNMLHDQIVPSSLFFLLISTLWPSDDKYRWTAPEGQEKLTGEASPSGGFISRRNGKVTSFC